MSRFFTLSVLAAAFLIALGGTAFADAEVTIGDDGLDPEKVEVDIREPIVWTNATDADVSLVGEDPNWESGPIEPGATFSIEITQDGTYTYGSQDGSLSGEIVVGQAGGNGGNDNGDAGNANNQGNNDGGNQDDAGGPDDEVEEIDPEDEKMPETGIATGIPAVLSVLLVTFGGGLLRVTQPVRRRKN